MYQFKLLVEEGISELKEILLDKAEQTIGRLETCEITLDHPYVSKNHAKIYEEDGGFLIKDLGSTNGTFVNSKRVDMDGVDLKNGDKIELSRKSNHNVVLRFWQTNSDRTLSDTITIDDLGKDNETTIKSPLYISITEKREVKRGLEVLEKLTAKEFNIFNYLYQNQHKACSYYEISYAGWRELHDAEIPDVASNGMINNMINKIRSKVEVDPNDPKYVVTEQRYGYRFINHEPK